MSNVWIQTEECYRKSERQNAALFPFFPMGPDVEMISSGQLVDVLNSAAKDGPDRHYVVVSESGQDGKALVSGTRNT